MRVPATATVALLVTLHASAGASAEQLQLEVILNDAPTRLIGSFSAADGEHISATRQELKDLGVAAPGGGSPSDVIGLDNIDGLSYRYDVAKQQVSVSVSDKLLAPKVYNVGPSASALPDVRSGYGAVLNYNLFAASNAFGPDGFGLN